MVAAHLAYIYAGVQEAELDARALFTLTSSRVFINVNHDFELEPEVHEVKALSLTAVPPVRVFENTQHFDGAWEPVTLYG